jgi:RNA polymerase sigma-70 factor (ECF subfamily)
MLDSVAELHDAELVSRTRKGDHESFAVLYDRYHKVVYGYLCSRILDSKSAAAMTREVFYKAHDGITRDDAAVRFNLWIKVLCRDLLRQRIQDRTDGGSQWAKLCLELDEAAPHFDASEDVLPLLPVAMRKLDNDAAKALEWHYEGQSPESIAEKLEMTTGDVQSMLAEARDELQAYIARHLGGSVI